MAKHYKETKNKVSWLEILLGLIIIFCLIYIGKWGIDNYKANSISRGLKEYVTIENTVTIEENEIEKYTIDFKKLKSENQDTIGWLKVNNTNVDYPIVQGTDNSYYLTHSFDKSYNKAGWIFVDYRNKLDGTDKNIVIYGHNMRSGTMFGTLKNALKNEWYNNEENNYITFATQEGNEIYKIFSIYKILAEDYYTDTNFKSDSEYEKFVETLKSRSIKKYNIEKTTRELQILTLSTCADNNKYRVIIHAYKLEEL